MKLKVDNASYLCFTIIIDIFVKNRMRVIYVPPYSSEFNLVKLFKR